VKVEWHPRALADLDELMVYIAADDLEAAYRTHKMVAEQVELLARFPEMGRPGRLSGTRELVINGTPYLAAYRVTDKIVLILRVLHGARRWPRKL
jgi:toxin ParE1/3/4